VWYGSCFDFREKIFGGCQSTRRLALHSLRLAFKPQHTFPSLPLRPAYHQQWQPLPSSPICARCSAAPSTCLHSPRSSTSLASSSSPQCTLASPQTCSSAWSCVSAFCFSPLSLAGSPFGATLVCDSCTPTLRVCALAALVLVLTTLVSYLATLVSAIHICCRD
jgi:hypothetical protein